MNQWQIIVTAGSLIVGIVGLVLAYLQYRSRARVEDARSTVFITLVDRINRLVSSTSYIRRVLKEMDRDEIASILWQQQKGLSSLYAHTVSLIVMHERRFTYDDLARMVTSGHVTGRWEEEIWRTAIALKPENRDRPVPDWHFPKKAKNQTKAKEVEVRETLSREDEK